MCPLGVGRCGMATVHLDDLPVGHLELGQDSATANNSSASNRWYTGSHLQVSCNNFV